MEGYVDALDGAIDKVLGNGKSQEPQALAESPKSCEPERPEPQGYEKPRSALETYRGFNRRNEKNRYRASRVGWRSPRPRSYAARHFGDE